MDSVLTFEKRGHIAVITLNRPEVRNAIDPEMMVRLAEAWIEYDRDDELRVAIVTGACPSPAWRRPTPRWPTTSSRGT